jgi:hypothetical protein
VWDERQRLVSWQIASPSLSNQSSPKSVSATVTSFSAMAEAPSTFVKFEGVSTATAER